MMENNRIKKLVGIVLIIVIISLLSFGLYSYFSHGDKKPSDDNNNVPSSPTDNTNKTYSIYQTVLSKDGSNVTIDGKIISLKLADNKLYVNEKAVPNIKADEAYVADDFIIFTYKGKCNRIISYVINADGEMVPFTKNNYQLYDFRILDNKYVAAGSDICPCKKENNCEENPGITLTYNGKELIIK